MQIKTTLRYHLTPMRLAYITKSQDQRCWHGCGEKGTLLHCWWECKLIHSFWKEIWRTLRDLKIDLPFNPVIPLLGIYPEDQKSHHNKDICIRIFIAALFIIAKSWKKPKCPSIHEWINKLWYMYTMEYHAALKKDGDLTSCMSRWMELEHILLSKVAQEWKKKYPMYSPLL